MNAVEIVPIAPEHIESFHRASILLPGSGDIWRFWTRGVLGIALLPPFRGQGIGKRLILRALDRAESG